MSRVLPSVFLLFLSASTAQAQVLITEVQPDTAANAEWVELHNTGGAAVSIAGWQLHDWAGASPGRLYTFAAGTMLAANQVVIVPMSAAAYTTVAMTNAYPDTTADFELAIGGDDPGVPNLTNNATGNAWALNNTGDAVELVDSTGAQIDAVEWGNVDRVEIAGTPAPDSGAGETVCRTNNVNDSSLDFVVCVTPTPGTGFNGVTPTPPAITSPVRAPASVLFGASFSLSATVTDADGVASASLYLATTTSSVGAAAGAYVAVPAASTGTNEWRAAGVIDSLIAFPAPASFSSRYIRYYFSATDMASSTAVLPAGAVSTAENTAYWWENVLPATAVFSIAEVRAQGANELPRWDGHSVRIEGIALTGRESFIAGSTNFFIAAPAGVDAIRVFDDVLIPTAISPGDMVRVTGRIGAFRGVRQIGRDERTGQPAVDGADVEVTIIGTAPAPMITTDIATLLANGEQNESQLIELPGVMLVPNPNGDPIPTSWIGNSTLYVSDGSGTLPVRVAAVIDLADTPTPSGMFDLRGIFTQFAPTGVGGYQLQPRSLADVIGGGPPIDAGVPDGGDMNDGGADDRGGMDATQNDGSVDATLDTGTGGPDVGPTDAARDAGFFGTDQGGRGCGCSAAEERSNAWALLPLLLLLGISRRRAWGSRAC